MDTADIRPLIERLQSCAASLYQKDFLLTWEQTTNDLRAVLLAAETLEHLWRTNISTRVFGRFHYEKINIGISKSLLIELNS